MDDKMMMMICNPEKAWQLPDHQLLTVLKNQIEMSKMLDIAC